MTRGLNDEICGMTREEVIKGKRIMEGEDR